MDALSVDFSILIPEIVLLTMACVVLFVDLYVPQRNKAMIQGLTLVTLALCALLAAQGIGDTPRISFNGSFISDSLSNLLKTLIFLTAMVVFVYSRRYLADREVLKGEFYLLGLFSLLGMSILVSAYSMVTVYLGLELLSLALYAMVALHRDELAPTEAAMKYFILGALASGMLLYGMSLLYGVTGTLQIDVLAQRASTAMEQDALLFLVGVVFLVVGVAFKFGAVPFHMWVPDVYHGAPTAMTLFISTAPKLAAFGMLYRLFAEGLITFHGEWQQYLIILAALSLVVGNVVAIAQRNLKRMFAYSAIAHVGYLFLGIVAGTEAGFASSLFYVIAYVIMGLGGFGMILLLSRKGFEGDRLEDLKGLNDTHPWYALMMLILMASMAGVPPTLGFYAKLAVIQAVVDSDQVWLAVLAVIFSVIGAFYYLRAIWYMYFDEPQVKVGINEAGGVAKALLSANSLLVLMLGIVPGGLLALCFQVIAG